MENPENLLSSLNSDTLPIRTVAPRTIYYKSDASLFFAGQSVRQRRLVGIDFSVEQEELSNLDFQAGGLEGLAHGDEGGILISEAAAGILGARVGDAVTLYMTTDTGQYNTANLIVRGIFHETSLFGYIAYMRRDELNTLLVRPPDSATDIAIYAEGGVNHDTLIQELRIVLSTEYSVLPFMPSKSSLYEELERADWSKGPVLAPLTLNAHLDQIKTLLDAFLIVTWFILIFFIMIVMVGILNTYRVLVHERTQEIGTMRALGMHRAEVRLLFLSEAALLAFISSVLGFILSFLLMYILHSINLGNLPGSGLFTESGFLRPHIEIKMIFITLFLMISSVTFAALIPANKASRIVPAEALRTEN